MKKAEFAEKLVERNDFLTKEKASKVINDVFEILGEALENGDHYTHDNFGSFKVVDRAPRKGRNPQTGEEILIPAQKAVKFTPSGSLKDKVSKL